MQTCRDLRQTGIESPIPKWGAPKHPQQQRRPKPPFLFGLPPLASKLAGLRTQKGLAAPIPEWGAPKHPQQQRRPKPPFLFGLPPLASKLAGLGGQTKTSRQRRDAAVVGVLQRGRDSNPRYSFPYTRFPGEPLQPLGHLSVQGGKTKGLAASFKVKFARSQAHSGNCAIFYRL